MKILSNGEPCPECGRYANRGITIDAVIIRGNKILLNKRGVEPFKGKWALPGGYVEWDESAPEAVAREVAEETGLHVTRTQLVGVYTDPRRHPKQAISIAYLVEATGEPKAGDDAEDSRFVLLDQLLPDLAFDHAQIIRAARAML
jgi:8-oxo-dGTP diphosphatase